MRHDKPIESGFALIVAIWIAGFVALVAAIFTMSVRSHVAVQSSLAATARATGYADAGVHLAILDLVSGRPGRTSRFAADGTVFACTPDRGVSLAIRVQDEAGRIDLNAADERLLTLLFRLGGKPDAEAAELADRVIDFRDADNLRRPRGAEGDDYAAAARPVPIKNAPFDAIEELEQVIGIDAGLARAIAPFVTVHSGQSGVDPTVAPPLLKTALPLGAAAASPRRTFRIVADAATDDGARVARDAVVEIEAGRITTWSLKRWRRSGSDGPATPAIGLPPC